MKRNPDNRNADVAALNAQMFGVVRRRDDWHWRVDFDNLIWQGADLNARDESGQTIFEYAVAHGQVDLAAFLLCNGVSWDVHAIETLLQAGIDRDSQLFGAVYCKDIDLVRLLFAHGADLNARLTGDLDRDEILLMYAAEQGGLNMVRWLLNHGADPHGQDLDGKTALTYAMQKGPWNYTVIDLTHKPEPSLIDKLVQWLQRKLVVRLLRYAGGLCCERDPDIRRLRSTKRLWSLVYVDPNSGISQFNFDDAEARRAIAGAADVNARCDKPWRNGFTLLTFAVELACKHQFSDDRCLKLLLRHGVDVNARNPDGTTALHHAAGKRRIIRMLKRAGAKE